MTGLKPGNPTIYGSQSQKHIRFPHSTSLEIGSIFKIQPVAPSNLNSPLAVMTLDKSIVPSRLDYTSQLWYPHLLKSIYLTEKVQRTFTQHIACIQNKSYNERIKLLNLYTIQIIRDSYQNIYLWEK